MDVAVIAVISAVAAILALIPEELKKWPELRISIVLVLLALAAFFGFKSFKKTLPQSKFGKKDGPGEAVRQLEKHSDSAEFKAVQPEECVKQQVTGDSNIFSGTGEVKVIHGDNFESGGGSQYIDKAPTVIQTEPGKKRKT